MTRIERVGADEGTKKSGEGIEKIRLKGDLSY